jgi:peptide/nickel transport system substrate-binding protein
VSIKRSAAVAAVMVSLVSASLGIAAYGSTPASSTDGRDAVRGGTAYFAEQPLSPPDYIFPLVSDQNYSVANTAEFQTLLYRPLYWYGDGGRPGVDYKLSLGDAPAYSDEDRTVTVTLKRARWSDGEAVSARDVGFWIDLLKANK